MPLLAADAIKDPGIVPGSECTQARRAHNWGDAEIRVRGTRKQGCGSTCREIRVRYTATGQARRPRGGRFSSGLPSAAAGAQAPCRVRVKPPARTSWTSGSAGASASASARRGGRSGGRGRTRPAPSRERAEGMAVASQGPTSRRRGARHRGPARGRGRTGGALRGDGEAAAGSRSGTRIAWCGRWPDSG
jgi:hypothetical protein